MKTPADSRRLAGELLDLVLDRIEASPGNPLEAQVHGAMACMYALGMTIACLPDEAARARVLQLVAELLPGCVAHYARGLDARTGGEDARPRRLDS